MEMIEETNMTFHSTSVHNMDVEHEEAYVKRAASFIYSDSDEDDAQVRPEIGGSNALLCGPV